VIDPAESYTLEPQGEAVEPPVVHEIGQPGGHRRRDPHRRFNCHDTPKRSLIQANRVLKP
jgi:hypothetical protein